MRLYNVTFDLSDTRTVLVPAIPETAGDTENKTIRRVCLADSVAHCVQALAHCNREVVSGRQFLVRSVDIDESDPALIFPAELKQKAYVPDALENNEYWYTNTLAVGVSLCEIDTFDYEFELAWTCIEKNECVGILEKHSKPGMYQQCASSEEAYNLFSRWCSKHQQWDEYDDTWEELAALPWAQKTGLYNFRYKVLDNIELDIER